MTYRPIPGHGRANARVLHAAGIAPWPTSRLELRGALARRSAAGRLPSATGDPLAVVLSTASGQRLLAGPALAPVRGPATP